MSDSTLEALERAVAAAPYDTTCRDLLLDYLEEYGYGDRARFIRLQRQLPRNRAFHTGRPPRGIHRRIMEELDGLTMRYIADNGPWTQEFWQRTGLTTPRPPAWWPSWQHGFVEAFNCTLSGWLGSPCNTCFQDHSRHCRECCGSAVAALWEGAALPSCGSTRSGGCACATRYQRRRMA